MQLPLCFGIVALLLLLVSACVSHTTRPYQLDVMGGVSGADAPALRTPGPHLEVVEVSGGRAGDHDDLKLYRPASCGASRGPELGALAYVSRSPGPKRWILVLPIWGSSTYPPPQAGHLAHARLPGAARMCCGFRTRGTPASSTTRPFGSRPRRRSSSRCCRVLRIASAPPPRTCGAGWTGSFTNRARTPAGLAWWDAPSAPWWVVSPWDGTARFGAGVLVMGGGHLDEILSTCYGEEAEVRRHAAEAFGWSQEEFQREVAAPLAAVDPVAVAGNINPAEVLFIDAGRDSCIPLSARDDLWEAMGRPERVTLGYDHKTSFLSMTFLGFDRTTQRVVGFSTQSCPSLSSRPRPFPPPPSAPNPNEPGLPCRPLHPDHGRV